MVLQTDLEKRGYIAGMIAAKQTLLEEAVKLRENGLNHDAGILTDAAKGLEAKINESQHTEGSNAPN